MEVTAKAATPNPIDVCSRAAGICYGKSDVSAKRLENCLRHGHTSVFEHASVTFEVDGVSRACLAQLTRHRLASYCVQSQRYSAVDVDRDDWYVEPPSCESARWDSTFERIPYEDCFKEAMEDAARAYRDALAAGIPPEDARYLLPEATKTRIVVTMNIRELFHFLDLRTAKSAQWEIRELAGEMRDAVAGIDGQYAELMEMRDRNS